MKFDALSTEPARPIGDDDVDAFERDGVVCLRGMFDAAWCRVLHDAALEAMDSNRGRVREPRLGEGQGRFYSSVYQSDLDARFARLRDASPAPAIAARLMRANEVRFFYDQLFIKAPGTVAPTPWHNDLPFWPFRGNDLVSIWIALTPVSLVVAPGERLRFVVTGADPRQRNLRDIRLDPPPNITVRLGGRTGSRIDLPLAP